LKGFVVTAASGLSCNYVRRHFSSQQSTLGLLAMFNVVAANDATARRIAASANANTVGITLPAVEKSVAQTTASAQLSGSSQPIILNTNAPVATTVASWYSGQKPFGSGAQAAAVVSLASLGMVLIAMLL